MAKAKWVNDFFYMGTAPRSTDSLRFMVSHPEEQPLLGFKLSQTARWLQVNPWKAGDAGIVTRSGPISAREQRRYDLHAAFILSCSPASHAVVEIRGPPSQQYPTVLFSGPDIIELEEEGIRSKSTPVRKKTLETLVKHTLSMAASRSGHIILRGAATYSLRPDERFDRSLDEVNLILGGKLQLGNGVPTALDHNIGKTITMLTALPKGCAPLANSHVWLRMTGNRLSILPQRFDTIPIRVSKGVYAELEAHDLDATAIERARESDGVAKLELRRVSNGALPRDTYSGDDVVIYARSSLETRLDLGFDARLSIVHPESVSLASRDATLLPKGETDALQQLSTAWSWSRGQLDRFFADFRVPERRAASAMNVLDRFVGDSAETLLHGVARRARYFELHGNPSFLVQLRGAYGVLRPVFDDDTLRERLGDIKPTLEQVTNFLGQLGATRPELRIGRLEISYYDRDALGILTLHRRVQEGQQKIEGYVFPRSYPVAMCDLTTGNLLLETLTHLTSRRAAAMILGLKLFDPDGRVVCSIETGSRQGVYLEHIDTLQNTPAAST